MRRRTVLVGTWVVTLLVFSAMRPAWADTLDEVNKRGTLVVGLEAEYVPYEFYKDGKIVGYDPDIIERFVDKLCQGAAGLYRLERHHPGALCQ